MTQDEARRMEYEEIYVGLMSQARMMYLAKCVAEGKLRANNSRLQTLTRNRSIFGRRSRQDEINALTEDNKSLSDGIAKVDQMLAQIITKLDEMEPNLGSRAAFYSRDEEGRWLRP